MHNSLSLGIISSFVALGRRSGSCWWSWGSWSSATTQCPVLLAVDEQLAEGAALRVTPELADPFGAFEVREHEDVEKLGARSRSEGGQVRAESALELIGPHQLRGYEVTAVLACSATGHCGGTLVSMMAAGKSRLTKDELDFIQSVLAASGDEWGIGKVLGHRRLTDEEREHVRDLLVPEMLKHGLESDGSLPPEGRAIDDLIGKLMFY
jgi:hypothetical protein